MDCASLTSVTIPDSVTLIGVMAFANCTNLSEAIFEGNAPITWLYAFRNVHNDFVIKYYAGTSGWTFPTWNDYPTQMIGGTSANFVDGGKCGEDLTWAFYDDGLLEIKGTGDMWSFGSNTMPWFDYRENIETIVIDYGVTNISGWAFSSCNNLTSITIPDSVITIGTYAFYYCTSLTSITIPDSVITIGTYAFSFNTSLTSVILGNGVITINDSAFWNSNAVSSIIIPSNVTTIGTYALPGFLGNITVDTNNQNFSDIDGVLFNKDKTIVIQYPTRRAGAYIIPDSVIEIGSNAFTYSWYLTNITIPNSVTSIKNHAFYGCNNLIDITIPASVSNIGGWTFYNCTSLKDIYFSSIIPPAVGSDAFQNVHPEAIAIVPSRWGQANPPVLENDLWHNLTIVYALCGDCGQTQCICVFYGDLTGSGEITAFDLVLLAQHIVKLEEINPLYLDAADLNGDGAVNVIDLLALARWLNGHQIPDDIAERLSWARDP